MRVSQTPLGQPQPPNPSAPCCPFQGRTHRKNRKQNSRELRSAYLFEIRRRTAKLSVRVSHSQIVFAVGKPHSEKCRHPHPEYRACAPYPDTFPHPPPSLFLQLPQALWKMSETAIENRFRSFLFKQRKNRFLHYF